MTIPQMLDGMSSVELSYRLALDSIRHKEAAKAERMSKAKHGR